MNSTSISFLALLQHANDAHHWDQLVHVYSPLIRAWVRRYDVQEADVDDLVQEVFIAVSKELKSFNHNGRPGAFRAWMRTILVNRLRNFWRARGRRPTVGGDSDLERRLEQLEDAASEMSAIWNQQHDAHVAKQLLDLAEPGFESTTWKAFTRVALEGARPDVVAQELGISRNAVFIAKSRVLRRLREQADGLIESSTSFFEKG